MIAAESTAPRIRVEELHGADGLAALATEWRALCDAADTPPFARPEWLVPWARHLADGEPLTLALRADERLVGVVPLQRDGDGLTLAGGALSDYRDAAVDAALPAEAVTEALARAMARHDAATLTLPGLHPRSPLRALPAPYGCDDQRTVDDACPYVPLPARADAIEALVTAHVTRDVARARRLLAAHALRVVSAGDVAPEALFDELLALHEARWRARGETGVLAQPHVQAFHREVVRGFATAGALELHALTVDGATLAVIYGFCVGGTAYYYLSGFHPAWARLSPGSLVIHVAMERAIARGCHTFDFLRGTEAYKYRWGARDAFTEQRIWRR